MHTHLCPALQSEAVPTSAQRASKIINLRLSFTLTPRLWPGPVQHPTLLKAPDQPPSPASRPLCPTTYVISPSHAISILKHLRIIMSKYNAWFPWILVTALTSSSPLLKYLGKKLGRVFHSLLLLTTTRCSKKSCWLYLYDLYKLLSHLSSIATLVQPLP